MDAAVAQPAPHILPSFPAIDGHFMATRDPVIIVGAGPAGLTVAVSLALQDVPVIVLESDSKLTRDLRAGSFHPPTLEMFGPLGVAEDFLNMGIRVPRWQVRDRRDVV